MSAYVKRNPPEAPDAPLSSRNVSRLTTYDLRQELVRRGKLDIPEDEINHKSMLQRLIQILLEDEQKAVDEKEALLEAERMAQFNATKAERERKKLEAIERSKQRQQNPAYFEALIETNILPEKKDLTALEELTSTDQIGESDVFSDDPFSSSYSKKNKVHIK